MKDRKSSVCPTLIASTKLRPEQLIAAKKVERQEAIVIVKAIEVSAFLIRSVLPKGVFSAGRSNEIAEKNRRYNDKKRRSCRTIKFAVTCFCAMSYGNFSNACFLCLCCTIFQKTPAFPGFGEKQWKNLKKT